MDFSKIAPYLQDPLILVGFALFLFFGFGRTLLKTGIIPTLTRGGGESVLKKLILYGFLLAIAIIILGFGLKYRQLSTAEQTAAVRLIHDEIKSNMAVLSELALNTETILGASNTVATAIRHPGIPLMSGLFPESNLSAEPLPTLQLAREALGNLNESKLLADPLEQQKYTKSALLLTTTIDNTINTITSLSDEDQNRYVLQNTAWQVHLPIMRKVTVVDTSEYQALYSDIQLGRQDYNVMAVHARNYMSSLNSFFSDDQLVVDEHVLATVLANERQFFSIATTYGSQLVDRIERAQELNGRLLSLVL